MRRPARSKNANTCGAGDWLRAWIVRAVALQLIVLPAFAQPSISSISNAIFHADTILVTTFTVADADGTVTNVAGTILENPDLAIITTALSGTNVTMTIQGNFNRSGTYTVEVIATDNNGFTATNHFTVTSTVEESIICPQIGQQVVRAGGVLASTQPQEIDSIGSS